MNDTAIKIEDISKLYRLGTVSTKTMAGDLHRWWARVRGKEDPFMQVGATNTLNSKDDNDYVWALRDINLEIKQGDVVGIIGKNGAGKSTLLKILSRVTAPTTGQITVNGRIASLLEVGTGFHPELTGRENIFLNGAILGMTKTEIRSKFDEIVYFSGVEKYVDTPVKRYSSGMYVRLAFAVAAHLEPEILIVDEVLAVGDMDFQKKAIGKMQDVSKGHGRTVLFVSHNMQAIQSLCSTTILMEQGAITMYGQTESIINKYLSHNSENKSEQEWDEASYPGNEFISVRSVKIKSESKTLYVTTPFEIEIVFRCLNQDSAINVSLVLKSIKDEIICNDSTQSKQLNSKWQRAVIKIPGNFLNDNVYTIDNYFVKDRSSVLFVHNEPITFEVHDTPRENTSWYGKWVGAVRPKFDWEYEEITEL